MNPFSQKFYSSKLNDRQLSVNEVYSQLSCTLSFQSLSHCELITDEGIRQISSSPCATEHLQVVELDNCPLITDASLEHLMCCQSLQRLEIYDCQLITRAGIRRLRVSISCFVLSVLFFVFYVFLLFGIPLCLL